MDPLTVAIVYAVVGIAVIPLVFAAFKTKYSFIDVLLASVGAAATSFVPEIGGPASLVVMIGILYWRIRSDLFPDILVAVAVARLTMVPVLLAVG